MKQYFEPIAEWIAMPEMEDVLTLSTLNNGSGEVWDLGDPENL